VATRAHTVSELERTLRSPANVMGADFPQDVSVHQPFRGAICARSMPGPALWMNIDPRQLRGTVIWLQ
jgi:hypothetical protein